MHQLNWIWWAVGGCTLVHFFWAGALLGLIALVMRRLLPTESFNLRYRLSVGFFILLLGLAPVLTWRVWVQIHRPTAVAMADDLDEMLPQDMLVSGGSRLAQGNVPTKHPSPHRKSSWSILSAQALAQLCPWLMVTWCLGSAWMLTSLAFGLIHSRRMRLRAVPVQHAATMALCRQTAESMGMRPVPVKTLNEIESPILAGILHPTILLPRSLSQTWTPEALELVLLHELSHVRRRDNAINLIQRMAECLLFFQPAVWLVSRWICADREECCDDLVVRRTGRRLEYVEILTQFARRQGSRRLAVAMGEHHIVGRVRRILGPSSHRPAHAGRAVLLAVFSVLCLSVLAATIQAQLVVPDRFPESQSSQPTQTSAPSTAGDGILLILQDESGAAMAGARMRTRAHWQLETLDPPHCPADLLADAEGVICLKNRKLLSDVPTCDRMIPFYIMDASGRLAATIGLALDDWGKTLHVKLQPLCQVSLALASSELEAVGRHPRMIKARISLPGNNGVNNLMGLSGDAAGEIRCGLPPGRYQMNCFAGTESTIDTEIRFTAFEVKAGQRELNLGLLDLTMAKKPKPWGKAAAPKAG